jgi:hypothetical protein
MCTFSGRCCNRIHLHTRSNIWPTAQYCDWCLYQSLNEVTSDALKKVKYNYLMTYRAQTKERVEMDRISCPLIQSRCSQAQNYLHLKITIKKSDTNIVLMKRSATFFSYFGNNIANVKEIAVIISPRSTFLALFLNLWFSNQRCMFSFYSPPILCKVPRLSFIFFVSYFHVVLFSLCWIILCPFSPHRPIQRLKILHRNCFIRFYSFVSNETRR